MLRVALESGSNAALSTSVSISAVLYAPAGRPQVVQRRGDGFPAARTNRLNRRDGLVLKWNVTMKMPGAGAAAAFAPSKSWFLERLQVGS